MSVDLGDLADLATAVGFLDGDGEPRAEWLAEPERYLKRVLADPEQRAALLRVADELLGGPEGVADEAGRTWLPLFERAPVSVNAVLGETAGGGAVQIGVGVRIRKPAGDGGVGVEADLLAPLFAASAATRVEDPFLLGTEDGDVELSLALSLPPGAVPGGIELDGVGLTAELPSDGEGQPSLGLSLRGLRLPGSAAARDVVVDAASVDELDDALLELVLGLVRAAAAGLDAADPAQGFAGLLGLVEGDEVPELPIAELPARGARAAAAWLASCLEGAARAQWLGYLAKLLSGAVDDGTVSVPLGDGTDLAIEPATSPGPGGAPLVTPRLSLGVAGASGTTLSFEVEPVSLDLASGRALALPALRVLARVVGDGTAPLLGPVAGPGGTPLTIGALEADLALDAGRRPTLHLALRNAVVGETTYELLDLTDGDALAGELASGAVEAVVDRLFEDLDPLPVLIGLADPPGAAAPRVDPARLLVDPLGALRARWGTLFAAGPASVRPVLAVLQSALAAETLRGRPIDGDGTRAAPYRLAVAAGVDLLLTVDGAVASLVLAAHRSAPLADAELAADLRVELLRAELADGAPAAQLPLAVLAALRLVPDGGDRLELDGGGFVLSSKGAGVRLGWDPLSGVRTDPWLDDGRLVLAGAGRALAGIGVGGEEALAFPPAIPDPPASWPAETWAAVESLAAAALAGLDDGDDDEPVAPLGAAARLLGWAADTPADAPRLSIAALLADPAAELRRWGRSALGASGEPGAAAAAERLAELLGRLLGSVAGAGAATSPWRLPLAAAAGRAGTPELLLALAGPGAERLASRAPAALAGWSPGDEGLPGDVLAAAIDADAAIDAALADVLAGRGSLAQGLEALVERWAETDGVVALPADLAPAGLKVRRPAGLVHVARLDSPAVAEALDAVWAELGAAPARTILVGVQAEGEPDPLPAPAAVGVVAEVDLTGAGLPLEAFPVPEPAPTGTTAVRLDGKAAAGGFEGQVARLRRALSGLAAAGAPVAVVAAGGAGRVAVAAAGGLAGIDAVVTVGTPWTPLALADLDAAPAAEAARTLRTLIEIGDAERAAGGGEPDDDLALARGLVDSLLARDVRGDPLAELAAPEEPLPAGLEVHAIVGSCSADAVRRALTSVFARSLSARAGTRAERAALERTVAALGLRAPAAIGAAAGGLRASIELSGDLLRRGDEGWTGRAVRIGLRLGADGRWLVGGPDPGRSGGSRPAALRAVTLELTVPLRSAAAAAGGGRLVLHDAAVFGARRARWEVDLGGDEPLVPEVGVLLAEVAAELRTEADAGIAGLVAGLRALGLLDAAGGFDATTLARLLADPAAVLAAVRADATRTAALAAGLRRAVGDARAGAGATVELGAGSASVLLDLAEPSVAVAARGGGAAGGPSAALEAAAGPHGTGVLARLGVPGLDDGASAPAVELAATCDVPVEGEPELSVRAIASGPRDRRGVTLWPTGPETAAELLALAPEAIEAAALAAISSGLRSALAGTGEADALDALLAAAGELPTSLPALVDATAGLLSSGPAGEPPGQLTLAPGVVLRAVPEGDAATIQLGVDAAAFAGAPAPLAPGLSAALRLGGGAARPELTAELALAGSGAVRLARTSDGVRLALAPERRPEIVLHPAARGLSALADTAAAGAFAALPALLTQLAASDPAGPATASTPPEIGGRVVARLGRALGLAEGSPAVFSRERLASFAADPAAAFAAAAAGLSDTGLQLVVSAAEATLGGGTRSARLAGGRVEIAAGPAARRLTLAWSPGAGRIELNANLAEPALPAGLEASAVVGPGGLEAIDVSVGLAPLDLGAATLSPFARVRAGAGRAEPSVDVGLGGGAATRLLVRLGRSGATLLAAPAAPGAPPESAEPAAVARAIVAALFDLAGDLVLRVDAVRTALGRPVLGASTTTAALLEGVVLAAPLADPPRLDGGLSAELDRPSKLLRRLAVLLGNVAPAAPAGLPIGDGLEVVVTDTGGGPNRELGLTVDVPGEEWLLNPGSEIAVGLVTDAGWIGPGDDGDRDVADGLTLGTVRLTAEGVELAPRLAVGGLGVRLSRRSGPLLDAGLAIDSVSLLGFGLLEAPGDGDPRIGGGARVELAGLAIPLGGASGGDNAVAKGTMPVAGEGEEGPAPRFSPALAVQKHPGDADFAVSLRAGSGDGPWFLAIQREFGPIYLEQVGLDVDEDGRRIAEIRVLIDGRIELFGLSAAVDDLSLGYRVGDSGSLLDPANWTVDVDGFSIAGELSGLRLAGGLRKFDRAGGLEYLGMLQARLDAYGVSVYGGFGEVSEGEAADRYTALFLFGAVNGPIGGPPAFFVTGIGGGFGANRRLLAPTDMERFPAYPPIAALDASKRPADPFAELDAARGYFPPERGQFWLSAGVSFTSFALVDGVVVVSVAAGRDFELSIFGLARMALPRPKLTLVNVELALVARVSASEGSVLVQAQLTDNSWLIDPAVRLTGGFAFAAWLSGSNRGQFVLTLGGYHPDFHRDGYPAVPRLGLSWKAGRAVTISGASYFALTSEALMAGLKVEAHAEIGPVWAHLVFGGDGIVYFDPFWLSVEIYASIDAGVTIKLWFARVTISVHLGARLEIVGPPFYALARFEVGPVGVTFEIGRKATQAEELAWGEFVPKYLEQAEPGVARVLAAAIAAGAIPPAGRAEAGGEASPDGQPDRPLRVVPEFAATVTSTMPLARVEPADTPAPAPSPTVFVAPMGTAGRAAPALALSLHRRVRATGFPERGAPDEIGALAVEPRAGAAFPIGVWGEPRPLTDPKLPAGDVLTATDRVELAAAATVPAPGPDILYRQVETEGRRALPLLATIDAAGAAAAGAAALAQALEDARAEFGDVDGDDAAIARRLLADRGGRDPLAVAAWQAGLAAPPTLGSLGQGLGVVPATAEVRRKKAPPPRKRTRRPPHARAVLASGEPHARRGKAGETRPRKSETSVSVELLQRHAGGEERVGRVAAPSVAAVAEGLLPTIPARLVVAAPRAQPTADTVIATGDATASSTGLPGAVAIAQRGAPRRARDALGARSRRLLNGGDQIADGEIVVLELPDADIDAADLPRPVLACAEGRVRAVSLGAAGLILADATFAAGERAAVPAGARTVVLVGGPSVPVGGADWRIVAGWSAARALPSAADGLLVAAGAVVDARGRVPHRGISPAQAAWVAPAELLGEARTTATTIAAAVAGEPPAAVAVVVSGAGADGLAIGLDGARQVGEPLVATGVRGGSALVLGLDGGAADGMLTVSVAADPQERPRALSGLVVAGRGEGAAGAADPEQAAAWLAGAVADADLADLVPPPTAPGFATSIVSWEDRR